MIKILKYCTILILVSFFIISSTTGIEVKSSLPIDYDPLVDVEVTVEIQKIRAFDKEDKQVRIEEYIDKTSDPDLYVKIIINDQEFISDIWHNTKYIYEPQFSATLNVPDDDEFVTVKIQLWDWNENGDVICDIADEKDDVELIYSIKTGHWTGDDQLEDPSGYGRLNGCDDGSIYIRDLDCELWFNIFQNDYDNDGIPYWTELNNYNTDPEVKNSGDPDGDEISVEWEWRWGYDPFEYEDHKNLDLDTDGINNIEEYLTSDWFSDPFRKDIFVEFDIMGDGPNGEITYFAEGGKELIRTAFNRQNIIFHLDDGSNNKIISGHDIIPFDNEIGRGELNIIYYNYFLHGDENNWRKGVFHYGVVVYNEDPCGYAFRSNAFQIAHLGLEKKVENPFLGDEDIVYGSAYMHELGHTLGFYPIYGHDGLSKNPFQIGWWINRPYKSCMNYGYMYTMVDYSDGSRPFRDLDDWERIDLTAFQGEWGGVPHK